jgi:hypothetical protein
MTLIGSFGPIKAGLQHNEHAMNALNGVRADEANLLRAAEDAAHSVMTAEMAVERAQARLSAFDRGAPSQQFAAAALPGVVPMPDSAVRERLVADIAAAENGLQAAKDQHAGACARHSAALQAANALQHRVYRDGPDPVEVG